MKFAKIFADTFAEIIVAVLSCFDRVIFKGYLPFGGDEHLNSWVNYVLKMRRKDFLPWLEQHSQPLVEHAKSMAERSGQPYEYRQGKFKKEKFIQKLVREDRLTEGLVAVLCVQETCRTVALKYGKGRPSLFFKRRPQRVLNYYHLDSEFDLMYVRLETWFPYTVQVYVNGHDWLARQMLKRRLGFVQHDKVMAKYLKLDLLILDDMGMKTLSKRSGEYLFEVIMRRHEIKSTMMTSNRPLEKRQS